MNQAGRLAVRANVELVWRTLMLEGKRLLITGVLTKGSIAYSVAERAQQQGAADACSPASGARDG